MKSVWSGLPPGWREVLTRYRAALLALAAGALLLLLPTGEGADPEPETGAGEPFDLAAFETRLERALSCVDGAGETKVVLTLAGGSRQVLAQDRARRGGEETSDSTVTLGRGAGGQTVVPLQTIAPSFRGALVICPGGGDPAVRLELARAVSALTGLGADRVSVCEGNR